MKDHIPYDMHPCRLHQLVFGYRAYPLYEVRNPEGDLVVKTVDLQSAAMYRDEQGGTIDLEPRKVVEEIGKFTIEHRRMIGMIYEAGTDTSRYY